MRELAAALDLRQRPTWRTTKNQIMTGVLASAMVAIAIPLVLVLWSVIEKGAGIAFADFPDFFTKDIPMISRKPGPGMGPAIVGTLLSTGGATLIAVPLGILGAIYLNEYGGNGRFARLVRFMAIVMTGVPSVVMGLFVYVTWTLSFGYSAFGGALALACLMLPVVIASTEQMLKLVPNHLREASFALGARKSRVIVSVVLPAALPGIVSGSLLAIARAAGETAPLMFAVGAAHEFSRDTAVDFFRHLPHDFLFEPNTALSVQIFSNVSTTAFEAAHARAWGAAFALVFLTFLATFAARIVTSRFELKK